MVNFNHIKLVGLIFSGLMIILSFAIIFYKGLNLGIDFQGGTIIEINADSNAKQIRLLLSNSIKHNFTIQDFNSNTFLIHVDSSDNNDILKIKDLLSKNLNGLEYRKIDSVGPKISHELIYSSIYAVIMAVFAILFYIWIRFEWQYSIGAILALIHDIFITLGFVSLLNLQFDISTIAAFLLILGYSINDTIVVYSRIRENVNLFTNYSIDQITNKSLNETIKRTCITSLTTTAILASMILFGGPVLFDFCLTMLIGIIIGTFSSIFVAVPVLLDLKKRHDA